MSFLADHLRDGDPWDRPAYYARKFEEEITFLRSKDGHCSHHAFTEQFPGQRPGALQEMIDEDIIQMKLSYIILTIK
jgi:hypothetical protein